MPREKTISRPSEDEAAEMSEMRQIEANAAQGLVPLVESPALNKLLLRNARKSFTEIEKVTGVPATEVAERLTELLSSRTWRDDVQEEQLLLAEIDDLLTEIRDRMKRIGVEDEAWASMARVALASIKTMLEQMDKRRKALDGKLSLISEMQAQLIGEAIKIAQERAILNIQKKFPDLDVEIIYAEFDEEFPKAIAYLEARADVPA